MDSCVVMFLLFDVADIRLSTVIQCTDKTENTIVVNGASILTLACLTTHKCGAFCIIACRNAIGLVCACSVHKQGQLFSKFQAIVIVACLIGQDDWFCAVGQGPRFLIALVTQEPRSYALQCENPCPWPSTLQVIEF